MYMVPVIVIKIYIFFIYTQNTGRPKHTKGYGLVFNSMVSIMYFTIILPTLVLHVTHTSCLHTPKLNCFTKCKHHHVSEIDIELLQYAFIALGIGLMLFAPLFILVTIFPLLFSKTIHPQRYFPISFPMIIFWCLCYPRSDL